jgi:hypothetical protein
VLSRVDAVDAVYLLDIPERVGWSAEHGRRRVRIRAQVRLVCAVLTFVISKADTGRLNVGVAGDGQAASEFECVVGGHVR